MNADGSNQRRLSTPATSYGPAWSPDGRFIAYESGNDDLYYIPATGGEVVAVVTDASQLSGVTWGTVE